MPSIVTSRTRRQYGRKPSWPYSVNWGSPQAQGLKLWCPGGPEGSNTLFDLVNGRNGTLTNGPTWSPTLDEAGCLAVKGNDASSTYIALPQMGFANPSSTFAWIKPDDTSAGDRRFWAPNAGATAGAVRQSGTTLESLNTAGSSWNTILSGLTAAWQHLGVMFLASGSAIGYRNGNAGSTVASTTPLMWQSQAWTFGANYAGFGTYIGACIHDLRVYNVEVPDSTIRAMYDPSTRWDLYYQPGMRAYFLPAAVSGGPWPWHMDNGMSGGLWHGGM